MIGVLEPTAAPATTTALWGSVVPAVQSRENSQPDEAERRGPVLPFAEFHTARHTLFSAEQNLEIDNVVSVNASVKTKLGRGGSYED